MSEDITKELQMSMDEKMDQLFVMLRNVIQGMNNLDARMTVIEQELTSLKAGTNPFWQVMHDQQQQIWATLQEHSARLDRLENHLQQQDEKNARLGETVAVGFRKLGDKFDHLAQDYYDLHADVVDVRRRVTQLEPIN